MFVFEWQESKQQAASKALITLLFQDSLEPCLASEWSLTQGGEFFRRKQILKFLASGYNYKYRRNKHGLRSKWVVLLLKNGLSI